jgi:peroxin-6
MTSPILAYNLALGCLKNTDPVHCPEVALRPLGSAYFAPVAQSVTLARVAAPLTTLKLYEQSLMRALRRQLSGSLHAVAEGDVICVGLDAGSSMRHGMIRSGNDDLWEEPSSSSSVPIILHIPYLWLTFSTVRVPYDAVAYYQVTELQVTLPPVNGFLTGMKTLAWIEPTKTTLVQVGATNITTPDVAAYMGIGAFTVIAPWLIIQHSHVMRPLRADTSIPNACHK